MLPVCACDGKLGSRHQGRALRRHMERAAEITERAAEIRIAISAVLLQIVVDELRFCGFAPRRFESDFC
jgi:hypothetical protein